MFYEKKGLTESRRRIHSHSLLQLEQVANTSRKSNNASEAAGAANYCVQPILQSIPSMAVRWPPPQRLGDGGPESVFHPMQKQSTHFDQSGCEIEPDNPVSSSGLLGEGATMIDLQVSGTFERNSPPGKNRDGSLSSSAQSDSSTRVLEEQISDKKGFLLRKRLLMKKKAEFQKKSKLKGGE